MTQNNVKFTAINFISEMFYWPYGGTVITDKIPISKANIPITMANLVNKNYQFLRNLIDYQYVKINYIAIKCLSLSHYGITQRHEDGKGTSFPLGVTTISGDMPIYVVWDLEQNIDDISNDANFGELISQYPYSKRWSPSMKRGPTFLYRVPFPYRQYLRTDEFKSTDYTYEFPNFMSSLTGYQNIRAPGKLWIGCKDWWTNNLPGAELAETAIRSNLEAKIYMGCTFRGRRLMNTGTTSTIPQSLFDEVSQKLQDKEFELEEKKNN